MEQACQAKRSKRICASKQRTVLVVVRDDLTQVLWDAVEKA